jgi:thiamine biosynthesis lipoprotein
MKTSALIQVHPRRGVRRRAVDAAIDKAVARTAEIEHTFSRFIPSSEICRLNESAGAWTRVSEDMRVVLEYSLGLFDQSGGLFDPGVLPDLERAGYDASFELLPADRPVRTAARGTRPSFGDIEMRHLDVRLPQGLRIDLGGIVKGWTADVLADDLSAVGSCLVEMGGDTAVRGAPPDAEGWSIGVQSHSRQSELMAIVEMASGGVATSAPDERRWKMGGAWAHHLIDPRTGEPSHTDLVQVTAFAQSGSAAEVWAKVALLSGSVGAARIVEEHTDVELLIVPETGEPVASRGVPFASPEPATA